MCSGCIYFLQAIVHADYYGNWTAILGQMLPKLMSQEQNVHHLGIDSKIRALGQAMIVVKSPKFLQAIQGAAFIVLH